MIRKLLVCHAVALVVAATAHAQDAKVVADNIEFSREFYAGVHLSAINEGQPSFAYQRYPDNGPERIQCDAGTFARQHGKPWLRSTDWGESGKPADTKTARNLDNWVKLVEAALAVAPSEVKLVDKRAANGRLEWQFEAQAAKQTARLSFGRALYDKSQAALLHGFEGALAGEQGSKPARAKFSFGYLINTGGYELSERAWEDLETPKEMQKQPVDLAKAELGPKPADAAGFVNRAEARAFNGDANGAIVDCNRALELDPKSVHAIYNRAVYKLQNKEDYDGAIADLTRAIELDSKTADYYSDRGLARLRKQDTEGAIADFSKAIELEPKNAVALRNRALAKNVRHDADGAIADFDRAIELEPKHANAFNSRGSIKKSKGDLDGAIADFNHAIELNDKLAIAYQGRGEAKQAKGDAAGAEADLKRAGELDPRLTRREAPTAADPVSLLDGKFKMELTPDFTRDPDDPKEPKTLAKFSGPDGAWGTVLRGTHGLTPEELQGYLDKRVAEYSKQFHLPKDAQLRWLKKELVTIDGRQWADWSFVPVLKGRSDYARNPAYTRNLTTSYKGQLLEINFTTNLNTDPKLKEEIDRIVASIHLEE
ncbi:MAG: tetratricopeptide repeat protein [Chthoniobacterales bacterium]